jgi:hypothetical protein
MCLPDSGDHDDSSFPVTAAIRSVLSMGEAMSSASQRSKLLGELVAMRSHVSDCDAVSLPCARPLRARLPRAQSIAAALLYITDYCTMPAPPASYLLKFTRRRSVIPAFPLIASLSVVLALQNSALPSARESTAEPVEADDASSLPVASSSPRPAQALSLSNLTYLDLADASEALTDS